MWGRERRAEINRAGGQKGTANSTSREAVAEAKGRTRGKRGRKEEARWEAAGGGGGLQGGNREGGRKERRAWGFGGRGREGTSGVKGDGDHEGTGDDERAKEAGGGSRKVKGQRGEDGGEQAEFFAAEGRGDIGGLVKWVGGGLQTMAQSVPLRGGEGHQARGCAGGSGRPCLSSWSATISRRGRRARGRCALSCGAANTSAGTRWGFREGTERHPIGQLGRREAGGHVCVYVARD